MNFLALCNAKTLACFWIVLESGQSQMPMYENKTKARSKWYFPGTLTLTVIQGMKPLEWDVAMVINTL